MARVSFLRAWAACGALSAVALVHAQDNPADCVRIDDDAARLVCYDRAHKRDPVPAGVSKPDAAPASPKPPPSSAAPSLFDDRWDLDGRRKGELFFPRAYKPVYVLPF
ncbi:MAG TPA: hypothetical protein VEX14_02310, partial [Burkholderiaceae bacterium]|nr:hypothetical protein [Burkholderiaceae bacterium]